ncbi:MAG: TRAP transporter large permease subunit, partial [Verrucomicrobiia bacterium]
CMMFGAVSGSAAAAVSSIGSSIIPEMERKGYTREFAVALTATSATTGLLIPPSNIMIVYAVVAGNVSVAALFLAGVLPGIVVGLLIMGVSLGLTLRSGAMQATDVGIELPSLGSALLGAVPSLVLVLLVLGGILGGVFSATEASAIAVAYALLLGVVVYREIPLARLPDIVLRAAKTTAV